MAVNARSIAPFAAIGVTYIVRKTVTKAYRSRTGHTPPATDDAAAPITEVFAWAIAVAIINASIEIAFTRVANRHSTAQEIMVDQDSSSEQAPSTVFAEPR